MLKYYNQFGGGSCSICDSPGTTRVTCPCNPMATKPSYEKHPNWVNVCPEGKIVTQAAKPQARPQARPQITKLPVKPQVKPQVKPKATKMLGEAQKSKKIIDISAQIDETRPLGPSLQKVLGSNFKIYGVSGDGNCLLHSFLFAYNPDYMNASSRVRSQMALDLRLAIADYIEKKSMEPDYDVYTPYTIAGKDKLVSLEEYLFWLRTTAGYLGEQEIITLSEMFNCNIIIFEVNYDVIYCTHMELYLNKPTVLISWYTLKKGMGVHYDPIVEVDNKNKVISTIFNLNELPELQNRIISYDDFCCKSNRGNPEICYLWEPTIEPLPPKKSPPKKSPPIEHISNPRIQRMITNVFNKFKTSGYVISPEFYPSLLQNLTKKANEDLELFESFIDQVNFDYRDEQNREIIMDFFPFLKNMN